MYAYRPTQHVSNFHPSSSPRLDFGPFHPLSLFLQSRAHCVYVRRRPTPPHMPAYVMITHRARVCAFSPQRLQREPSHSPKRRLPPSVYFPMRVRGFPRTGPTACAPANHRSVVSNFTRSPSRLTLPALGYQAVCADPAGKQSCCACVWLPSHPLRPARHARAWAGHVTFSPRGLASLPLPPLGFPASF